VDQGRVAAHRQRYRITLGRYRIAYDVEDDELVVFVITVGHRRDVSSSLIKLLYRSTRSGQGSFLRNNRASVSLPLTGAVRRYKRCCCPQ
jgi:hypothetical protein